MKVALDNLDLALISKQEANNTKSVEEHVARIIQARQYAFVSIVFSAFTLEAYINNYAARKRSNSFFKEHLDNIDFVSKWIIIPELFTGKPFPKDKQSYEYLIELRKIRNELVHSKSSTLNIENSADVEKVGNSVYEIIKSAEKAVKTISMVVKTLVEIDTTEKEYLSGLLDIKDKPNK
jgi:hypothetical protein